MWAMGTDSVDRFVAGVEEKGYGTVKDGGQGWWPDENYLMSEGIRTFIGFFNPGDLLYLGPSTFHWSYSLTPSVQSSWCLLPPSLPHFSSLFSSPNVPLQPHTLSLDLLNHQLSSLPPPLVSYLCDKLSSKFDQETALIEKTRLKSFGVFPGHKVVHCDKCKSELFFAYISCNRCETAMCIRCGKRHRHKIHGFCSLFRTEDFNRLKTRVKQRLEGGAEDLYDPEINLQFTVKDREREIQLWRGPFDGVANCIYYRKKEGETGKEQRKEPEKQEKQEKQENREGISGGNQPGDNEYVIPKKQKGRNRVN